MYRLIRFGTLDIEHYNQVEPIGTGATPTAYQALPDGGAIDLFGSMQKHPGTVERVKSFRLRGASQADLESLYFALLSLRGKRDRLYRETVSGDIHWQYARLIEVIAQRTYEKTKYGLIQDVDLRFVTQEAHWRGDYGGTWYLDSGEYLDTGLALDSAQSFNLASSPASITVTTSNSNGRAPVRALIIKITAGSSAITSVTIARFGGESLAFDGTIAAGDELVINTGSMQVTNNDAEAYSDLLLLPTADLASWFALEPGDNDLTVTFSGGGTGSKIEFEYYEAWY